MTDEQIDALKAGRDMDLIIGEEIVGWSRDENVPMPYSTDIAAAWEEVVERMAEFKVEKPGDWSDQVRWRAVLRIEYGGPMAEAYADTAPLAICRAALKAHFHADKAHSKNTE